jgi:hypothetical protein
MPDNFNIVELRKEGEQPFTDHLGIISNEELHIHLLLIVFLK